MQHLEILAHALEYIEDNIANPMKTEEIAKACYCSKTALEKIFRCINNISVHDYITRRRMTRAGRMLYEQPDRRILDIAVEFGFSSNESFTRTFQQIWNCTPSEFRKKNKFSELFPRYAEYKDMEEVNRMTGRKNVDISELYDLFCERKGCYFVCGDIKHLIPFNEISMKAGDLAILEALQRMNDAASEEDYVFRIGADEFVMLTNSREEAYAKRIAEQIAERNGEPIVFEGRELPVEMYVGVTRLEEKCVCYKDLFEELHTTIMEAKGKS